MSEAIFYKCDPNKNTECRKTGCFENGGECEMTTNEELAINGKRYIFDAVIGRYTYADEEEKLTLQQAIQDTKFYMRSETWKEAALPERVLKKIFEAADIYNNAINKYEDEVNAQAYIQGIQDGMFTERMNIIEGLIGELEEVKKAELDGDGFINVVGITFAIEVLKGMKEKFEEAQKCRSKTK